MWKRNADARRMGNVERRSRSDLPHLFGRTRYRCNAAAGDALTPSGFGMRPDKYGVSYPTVYDGGGYCGNRGCPCVDVHRKVAKRLICNRRPTRAEVRAWRPAKVWVWR